VKATVEYLQTKGIICKKLSEISPKELGSRKKVQLFIGVDMKGYYCLIMKLTKKSRVIRKEALELLALHKKLEQLKDTKITKCTLILNAPLCSHARAILEGEKWKVWEEG